LFAGMAYLVRYDALFLVPGLGFALLVINLNRESLRPRLVKAGLFVCGALLVVSPWLIVNWRTHGSPFASTGYLLVATRFYMPGQQQQLNAALKERAPAAAIARLRVATQFHSFFDVVSYDPPRFLRKYLEGLYSNVRRLAIDGLRFPAYLVAPIGLALLLRHLPRTRQTYYCVCLLGFLSLGLVRYHTRFYLFLFPLGFLSVAYLFVEALPTAGPLRNIKVPVGWLLVFITAAFLGVSASRQISHGIASEPRYLFGIAEFLRNRSSPGDIIIGRKPHLAYLAGLVNTFPFVESADAYLAEAQERGARYVVYSAFEASEWPGLKSLQDPSAVPAGLKLIHYHPASETLIYEVDSRPQEANEGVRVITGKEK
jgi:mannose/fructose/N-acetylgalactosamine-specific phosphotransferase system component IIC